MRFRHGLLLLHPGTSGWGIRLFAVTEYYTVISRMLFAKTAIESPATQQYWCGLPGLAANLSTGSDYHSGKKKLHLSPTIFGRQFSLQATLSISTHNGFVPHK